MVSIRVRTPNDSERAFRSFSEAISYKPDRASTSEAKSKFLIGHTICDGSWIDSEVVFTLENGTWLKIYLEGFVVEWVIGDANKPNFSQSCIGDSGKVLLQFVRDPQCPIDSTWNRESLMRQRMRKQITGISVGDSWLFLYVENEPILLFQAIIREDTNELVLHWDETD